VFPYVYSNPLNFFFKDSNVGRSTHSTAIYTVKSTTGTAFENSMIPGCSDNETSTLVAFFYTELVSFELYHFDMNISMNMLSQDSRVFQVNLSDFKWFWFRSLLLWWSEFCPLSFDEF
jgi:hypothetical protein